MTEQPERETSLYAVLKCDPTATHDQLKRSYQTLAREHHPDKNPDRGSDRSDEQFMRIDGAWKVLRDEGLRRRYDASVMQDMAGGHSLVYVELDRRKLLELFSTNNTDVIEQPCRCGSRFEVLRAYLDGQEEEEECMIECSECSNCLLIK